MTAAPAPDVAEDMMLSDMAIEHIARAMYKWEEGDHDARMTAMTIAKVAISAHLAALDAAGWAVVPKVATEEMIEAGVMNLWNMPAATARVACQNVLHGMLAARPK